MKKTLNYISPINGLGYGVAGVGYAMGLDSLGVKFNWIPIGNPDIKSVDPKFQGTVASILASSKMDPELPNFVFWHFNDIISKHSTNLENSIAFSTFELDTLTEQESFNIQKFGLVGTTTDFHRRVLTDYVTSITPPIPHAYRVTANDPIPTIKTDNPVDVWRQVLGIRLHPDTLVISSCGKYEKRKGFPELLEAFSIYDNPLLLVTFWHNPFTSEAYPFSKLHTMSLEPVFTKSGIKTFRQGNKYLVLMPPAPTREELHGALARAHYFIAPSRAEGWNLPLFEMGSMGMPVIATDCEGHTEYLKGESYLKLDIYDYEVANDPPFFNGNGNWGIIYPLDIVSMLEFANTHRNEPDYRIRAESLKKDLSQYTWQESAKIILSQLERLKQLT